MSGMFNSLIKYDLPNGFMWKYFAFVGLITIPFLTFYFADESFLIGDRQFTFFDPQYTFNAVLGWYGWLIGGFLVGIGTKMGNGCTSGHAVCGIPRLSIRSIVATGTFMIAAIVIATLRFKFNFLYGEKTI